MNERVYNRGVDPLRSPERVSRLEVNRVVDNCLMDTNISSVLDVGTGSGLFAEEFSKRGLKVAAIDPNPEMITATQIFFRLLISVKLLLKKSPLRTIPSISFLWAWFFMKLRITYKSLKRHPG
jgi:SAM-dependent methyltransferase